MAVQNGTPASPSANANAKQMVFFNAASISNISNTFSVNTEPFYIRGFNLASGDTVTVQAVGGTGSGTMFENWQPLGSPVQLTENQQQLRIDWPGQYRLVFSGASVSAITVSGNEAAFSEPSIYGASASSGGGGTGFALTASDTTTIDLTFTGNTAGGVLTANANLFTLPPSAVATWPGTLVSADNLQRILNAVGSSPRITFVGASAGSNTLSDSSSYGSTCVGYNAGTNMPGLSKVVIGNDAGAGVNAFLMNDCVVIGHNALIGATPGSDTDGFVAIGHNVGLNTAFQNGVLIGRAAGGNTLGNDIVCIGDGAGTGKVGDNHVYVGNSAGSAGSGDQGTGIGHFALDRATGGRHSALGYLAGQLAANGSTDCIYIGVRAGRGETHDNVIIISSGATDQNASADDQIILGNSSHTELRTAGSIIAAGVISASDSRLKKDVVPLNGSLKKIAALVPVEFSWDGNRLHEAGLPYVKSDLAKRQSGVIAQDFKQIFPEYIEQVAGSDGELYEYVRYDRLVPHLLAAVQELSARVLALESAK